MDVEKFLDKIRKRPVNHKGKLAMWHEDIFKLRSAGCTYAQIIEYLELQDVQVSISAVQSFCSKHFNNAKTTKQSQEEPDNHHVNKNTTKAHAPMIKESSNSPTKDPAFYIL